MNVPLQLIMGMSPAHRNQYLFSDHYLNNLLRQDSRWELALPEAEAFLTWLQGLYAREKAQLPNYIESQLEDHWFKPILTRLGHVFERQAGVPGLNAGVKHPDYVFFPDEAARQAAVDAQKTEDYAADALAVGEVKRWDVPLGKKQKGGGASFEAQNPSWQIDYYVRATGLDWGILSNGQLWRLVHKDTSQRLAIYYEVDLVDLLSQGDAEAMRYFTLFFRQAAFRPDAQGRVFLKDALAASNAYAVALEEDLERNVYQALERLMQGFLDLPKNGLGADDLRHIYDNSLYLLYRLLFILYGESRGLLPLQNDQYRINYSLTRIKQEIADLKAMPAPMTTLYWGQLQNLFHIINGDDAELNRYLGVPRYNGGLFHPQLHPFLEQKAVGDRALVEAIDLLSRRTTEAGREFVDYRTLGVRHLGSIYEGLLEYQPRYAAEPMAAIRDRKGERWVKTSEVFRDLRGLRVLDRREIGQVYLETDRGERKATGSYYTPQYIVEYIVENTLGPLVDEAVERVKARAKRARGKAAHAEAEQALRRSSGQALVDEILSLKVLDPAMGSGHFLVEATEYLALELATDPYVETEVPVEEDLIHWKRRVVERCIYGVDKNPLAVELAKLSLWLATVAADKPLSFLDHHLKCGDSLIGARVADLGDVPPVMLSKKALREREEQAAAGARQANLFEIRLSEKLPIVMGRILEITGVESDSYDTVQAKEAADQAVQRLKAPFEAVADLWVSAHFGHEFAQGDYEESLGLIGQPDELLALPAVEQARKIVDDRNFFHWELAFPEVFYDRFGRPLKEEAGFHAVVGNPPYLSVEQVPSEIKRYWADVFAVLKKRFDAYGLFLYTGSSDLLRQAGLLGLIVPTTFFDNLSYSKLRDFLKRKTNIRVLWNLGDGVFPDAKNDVCIIVLSDVHRYLEQVIVKDTSYDRDIGVSIPRDRLFLSPEDRISTKISPTLLSIQSELKTQSCPLEELIQGTQGFVTGLNEAFVLTPIQVAQFPKSARELVKPISFGQHIGRYYQKESEEYLLYLTGEIDLEDYPSVRQWLLPYKDRLSQRREVRRGLIPWYTLQWPRDRWYFESRHAIYVQIIRNLRLTRRLIASFNMHEAYADHTLNVIRLRSEVSYSPAFILALLDSNLFNWLFLHLYTDINIKLAYLKELPIRRISFTTPMGERERLVKVGITEATEWIEATEGASVNSVVFSAFSDSKPGRWLDARLDAEPEQADVIHDLLAHLAEQMIAMNKGKQAAVEAFWLDLEGITDVATFKTLRNKGKQERTLWKKATVCRPFVRETSHATRRLDQSLSWSEEAFKAFVKTLLGKVQGLSDLVGVYRKHHSTYRELIARIEATDCLIDQIVYKLYGLTEEEIAIVEGRGG